MPLSVLNDIMNTQLGFEDNELIDVGYEPEDIDVLPVGD